MKTSRLTLPTLIILLAALTAAQAALAQATNAPAARRGAQGPQVTSPEVMPDGRVAFRIVAPKAETVRLIAGDIPGNGEGAPLAKGTNDVWEVTLEPVRAGAYRYHFNVDGVPVIDPRNPLTSQSNNNTWSLVYIPGADFMDTKEVPHGAVSAVTYYSTSLKRFRRLHVYTPPGYENGQGKFPVFYLLHGAGDSDASWSSVGRAGFILDNLIAAHKAKPMLVVMPAGHAGPFRPGGPRPVVDDFTKDFIDDIVPLIEKNYRVHTDREHRALAGLSMGGGQTLNIGIPHLEDFSYLGVFSSGVFGITGRNRDGSTNAPTGPSFEERHKSKLDDSSLKAGLKLFWFATGKDDFVLETSRATVAMLKKHQFNVVYEETEGGHTWINWREYLNQFAPQLFR